MFDLLKVSGYVRDLSINVENTHTAEAPMYRALYSFDLDFSYNMVLARPTRWEALDINEGDVVTVVAHKRWFKNSYEVFELRNESNGSMHSRSIISNIFYGICGFIAFFIIGFILILIPIICIIGYIFFIEAVNFGVYRTIQRIRAHILIR